MKPSRPANPNRQVLFQQFARIGHALSNPARLAMLSLLTHGEKSVDQLAQATGQTLATASANLKVLRGACLVASEKRGRQVFCRLAGENVTRFWLHLRELGEEILPEAQDVLRQFHDDPQELAELGPLALAAELQQGRVTLLDLRPPEEFAAGHLPGARSLPFSRITPAELKSQGRLPAGRIYAYCRGPYCIMAREGTRRLRRLGVPARRLSFSVPEWNAAIRTAIPLQPSCSVPPFL